MKTKTAIIAVLPITKIRFFDGGMSFQHVTPGHLLPPWERPPSTEFTFTTLDNLAGIVKVVADTYNETNKHEGCVVWVAIKGRKPSGFKRDGRLQSPVFIKGQPGIGYHAA